jgi:hypothetical protein
MALEKLKRSVQYFYDWIQALYFALFVFLSGKDLIDSEGRRIAKQKGVCLVGVSPGNKKYTKETVRKLLVDIEPLFSKVSIHLVPSHVVDHSFYSISTSHGLHKCSSSQRGWKSEVQSSSKRKNNHRFRVQKIECTSDRLFQTLRKGQDCFDQLGRSRKASRLSILVHVHPNSVRQQSRF